MKPVPKYKELASALTVEIKQTKRYRPGMKLPGCRELAKDYGMSYVTVTNAIRRLEEKGLVKRVHGQGIFVEEPITKVKTVKPRIVGLMTPFKGDVFGNMCSIFINRFESENILTVPLLDDIIFYYTLPIEDIKNKFSRIIDQGIESLIIYGHRHFPFKIFQEFADKFKSINYVIYHESLLKPATPNYFLSDNFVAGRLAADHLIKKGWHEILFITYERMHPAAYLQCGPVEGSDIQFMQGIKQAYADNNLDSTQYLREAYDGTVLNDFSVINTTSDFLDGKDRGIIAFGDSRMKWVYDVARKKSLVPGIDFGAIGWGNTSWCTMLSPSLTTLSIDEQLIASDTADAILNNKSNINKLTAPKLVIRESTGGSSEEC